MTINVAINGYGRIGRMILRALYESKRMAELRVVAINDLGDVPTNVHLIRYDSVHGTFPGQVRAEGDGLIVEGDPVRVLSQRSRAQPDGQTHAQSRDRGGRIMLGAEVVGDHYHRAVDLPKLRQSAFGFFRC